MAKSEPAALLAAYVTVGTDELKACRVFERMDKRLEEAGGDLDFEAAQKLVSLLGESAMLIDNELRKLAGMFPQARIGAAQVEANVSHVAPFKPWDFTDQVMKRDVRAAMEIFAQIPSGDLYGLFLQTVSTLRELLCAKVLDGSGRVGELAERVGELRGRPVQAWQLKSHVASSRKYTLPELRHALESAADCDAALKSSPDKELVLTRWFLSFLAPSGR